MKFSLLAIFIGILLPFFTGCENILQTDLVAEGKVTAKTGDSSVLDISTPKVVQNGDAVDISGTVTRKPGMDAPIPNGYLLIQLLDAGGNDLDDIWSTWSPADIPTDGARQATYSVHYLWTAPPGATVNVLYGPSAEGLYAGGNGGGKGGPGHAPPRAVSHHYGRSGSFSSGLGFK